MQNLVIDPAPAGSPGAVSAAGDPIEAELVRAEVRARLFGGQRPPLRIGRFEIGKRIGAGAMGVVYEGRDHELSRTIALKLLLDPANDLRREAQALAKLRHPNVVAVHEVGAWQELPFVAMEHVDGTPLRAWLAERKRSVAEVVRVFLGAARGLAAAHAAGLVHRDFKIDNVVVDRDGSARVVDFGLARVIGETRAGMQVGAVAAGTVAAGTPAYMAPEVLRGEPATPASDQFSFGVAFYEALAGARPFLGANAAVLLAAIESHAHARIAVPRAIHVAIDRCLAATPAARFAAMTDVASALEAQPKPLWPVVVGATAAPAIAVAAIFAFAGRGELAPLANPVQDDPCELASAPIEQAWNAQTRTRVAEAFAGTHQTFAPTAATRVAQILDGYRARWTLVATRVCRDTTARTISDATSALEAACLDDARRDVIAIVDRFLAADARTVEKAVAAVGALPAVESCEDIGALAGRVPPPQDPQLAQRLVASRDRLAVARARVAAGQAKDAIPELQSLATAADALAYAPFTAETQLALGLAAANAGQLPLAEPAFERAYREGLAGRDDAVAANAALKLANLHGHVRDQIAEGRRWLADADALVRRGGRANDLVAWHHNITGNLEQTAGNYDLALAAFARAETAWRASPSDRRIDIAGAMHNAGNSLVAQGKSREALAKLHAAQALWTSVLGAEHPLVAMATGSTTSAMRDLGMYTEALALDEAVLARELARVGKDHLDVTFARGALANDLRGLGRFEEALAEYAAIRVAFAAQLGPTHRNVASTDGNIGTVLLALGRYAEAEPALKAALAAKEQRGLTHPSLVSTLDALGHLALRRGRVAEARKHFTRSLAIGEAAFGKASSDLADALGGLGEAALLDRKPGDARRFLERALAAREQAGSPEELALLRVSLGRARWELGDRDAGRALVAAAAPLIGPSHPYERSVARAWLAAH